MIGFGRRAFLGFGLASARALKVAGQSQQSGAALLKQFQFESKLWPNLHHFLYILGRARNGAFDSGRVAVKQAPLDIAGFDALPESQRKAWEHAVGVYQAQASPLDIGYGSLVDVNSAVADLPAGGGIEDAKEIPDELRAALAEAGAVYRGLWWPRHDAANLQWIAQLTPQVERYGPRIKERLATVFRASWPTLPLRVEAVAYADPRGGYTTADPPLITMSSLNPEHQGVDGLEQLFHECSHLMMHTVDTALRSRAKTAGKELSRDVSHTILFYTVADTVRALIPGRVPYPDHYGVWNRGWTRYRELLGLYWQPYLEGKSTMDDAIDRLVHDL
ncbi:MAG TPA: hypothetical protein VMJ75_13355 [Candidatus Acidoferrales bacterium]|nr:hypothetical protein [Candidatus Acidoferrales bacterium]